MYLFRWHCIVCIVGIGDEVIEGYYHLPKSELGNNPVVDWPTRGDSMIDASIEEGDVLRVELGALPRDGDIVIASVDNEYTAKAFFQDNAGRRWLCPRNRNYDCILLTEKMNVRIAGVVRSIIKKAPRQSYSECASIVDMTLNRRQKGGDMFEQAAKAVADGCHLFWAASAWAVVYGVLRDCCGYEGTVKDFERRAESMSLPATFGHRCTTGTVQRTISNHPYMRLHVDKWKEKGASLREQVLKEFLKNFLL